MLWKAATVTGQWLTPIQRQTRLRPRLARSRSRVPNRCLPIRPSRLPENEPALFPDRKQKTQRRLDPGRPRAFTVIRSRRLPVFQIAPQLPTFFA